MNLKNLYSETTKPLVIALGDPAGIGIEVTLKALNSLIIPLEKQPLLVGCRKSIEKIYFQLKSKGINNLANPKELKIKDLPLPGEFKLGQSTPKTAGASFQWLTHASKLVMNNQGRALVTGPICKETWWAAGFKYPGQTERLAELAGTNNSSMLFTAVSPRSKWRFNTLLATTHIPLSEVTKLLNPQLILEKLEILSQFCKKFKDHPTIAISGLNPHAGEKGLLGKEESEWLIPLLDNWKKQNPSIQLIGPLAPDSCWISAGKAWQTSPDENTPDGFLALYHDQGLIPLKLLAFDQAVNTTLGLPFIRTSPDHGTGLDIANEGSARPGSMIAAIKAAWELSEEPLERLDLH